MIQLYTFTAAISLIITLLFHWQTTNFKLLFKQCSITITTSLVILTLCLILSGYLNV